VTERMLLSFVEMSELAVRKRLRTAILRGSTPVRRVTGAADAQPAATVGPVGRVASAAADSSEGIRIQSSG
jgi:hypothetical protein